MFLLIYSLKWWIQISIRNPTFYKIRVVSIRQACPREWKGARRTVVSVRRWAGPSSRCQFSHRQIPRVIHIWYWRAWSVATPQNDTGLGHAIGVNGLSRWTPWTIPPLWLAQTGFSLAADVHVFLFQLFFLEQTYVLWPVQGKSHSSLCSELFLCWNNSPVYPWPLKIWFPCPGLVLWISLEDPKARKAIGITKGLLLLPSICDISGFASDWLLFPWPESEL